MKLQSILSTMLISLLATCFLCSCQTPNEKEEPKTAEKNEKSEDLLSPQDQPAILSQLPERTKIGNFAYKHHRKTGAAKPYPGAYVQYHFLLKKDGEEVKNSFGSNPPPIGIMMTEEELAANPSPLQAGLRLMSEGDSITISTAGAKGYKAEFTYELTLVKIL